MEGWIKLNRRLREWEWYQDPNVVRVWLHLLLSCNYEAKNWRGIVVEPGQLVTSYGHVASSLGLSVHQVRTALDKLKSTGEVTTKTTNKYTIVTIEKWGVYQQKDDSDGKQNDTQYGKLMADNWQTAGIQSATTKEGKEAKKLRTKESNPIQSNKYNRGPTLESLNNDHESFMARWKQLMSEEL